ncbi:hypothetical protein ID866_10505 [Astraeus odoratus]|nr:hypothetical protein ID866_10505 [Astraeus odoratus]
MALNVVFAGETGHGKSSLVNIVVGRKVSKVSPDAQAGTNETQPFVAFQDSTMYRIWDTPGFNSGAGSTVSPKKALGSLFKELLSKDGVHLLVYCLRVRSAVNMGHYRVYKSILSCICDVNVPIVAVVTHADEMLEPLQDDWNVHKGYEMKFANHICLSTLRDEMYPATLGRRLSTTKSIWRLIQGHVRRTPLSLPREMNVVLFGGAEAGKGSVIDLIAGEPKVEVSQGTLSNASGSRGYRIDIGPYRFRLWDTTDLNQPDVRADEFMAAIDQASRLIRSLTDAGGINLLLFCVRKDTLSPRIQANYRLFYEVLCDKEVPIGLVITHLEHEDNMEDYWTKISESLKQWDVVTIGHACVTTSPSYPEKCQISKVVVQGLLTYCDCSGRYTMPADPWLKRLKSSLSQRFHAGESLASTLKRRCGLAPEIAERLAVRLMPRQDA